MEKKSRFVRHLFENFRDRGLVDLDKLLPELAKQRLERRVYPYLKLVEVIVELLETFDQRGKTRRNL
jgi:nitrate reductase assembly molybdenum cofactor insertion protein NarJ